MGLPRLRADLPTPAEAGFAKAGALQRAGTSLRPLHHVVQGKYQSRQGGIHP
jgi:hypothetical protein